MRNKLWSVTVLAGALAMAGCGGSSTPVVTPSTVPSLHLPPSTAPAATAPATTATTAPAKPSSSASPSVSVAPTSASTGTTSVSKAPSATPLPSADSAQAITALDAWWTQLERVYTDPSVPVSSLDSLTSGNGRTTTHAFVEGMRKDKLHTTGHAQWVSQQVTSASSAGGLDLVQIKTCQDVSKLRVLDAKGKDITPKTRKDRASGAYMVSRKGDAPWTVSWIAGVQSSC